MSSGGDVRVSVVKTADVRDGDDLPLSLRFDLAACVAPVEVSAHWAGRIGAAAVIDGCAWHQEALHPSY